METGILISIAALTLSSSVIVKIIDVIWERIKTKNGKKTDADIMLENTNKMVTEIAGELVAIKKEISSNTEANKSLLKDKVYYLSGKMIERGYIYQTESINFNELFEIYQKRFNGNHIDHLVEQVNELPIRKDVI